MIHVLLTEKKNATGFQLKAFLEKKEYINIVGVTENSIEILYALIQNRVDLMIIDKSLKNINEADCAGMVSKLNIDVKIILLLEDEKELASTWNPDLFAGYILKNYSPGEIMETIAHIMNPNPKSLIAQKGNFASEAVYG
jgi:DNA-binding NarL/FixJ family response regulator